MKTQFPFLDPKVVMSVIVALIILGVGTFAFFITWGEISEQDALALSDTECQAVTNPAVQQTVTIPEGATIIRVYETLNSGTTQNIDAANYTYAGTTVTINVTG